MHETPDQKRARLAAEMQQRARDSWVTKKPPKRWSRVGSISVPLNTPFPWVRWETPR